MTKEDIEIILSVMKSHISKNGYITLTGSEHRLIMALHLNRPLKSNESIHHINGNKHDNRIENLLLLDKKSHTELHNELVKYVTSDNNKKEKHPKWNNEITLEILLNSFDKCKSLRKMEIDLHMTRKSISDRFNYYGYKVIRQRAKIGYGWENNIEKYITNE